jgi:hypothetical protein
MVAKKKTYKLDLFGKVLPAIDKKDYGFYDKLSTEEKKGFTGFVALQMSVNVTDNQTVQHYYLASMNHHANKYMFDLKHKDHAKLHWLMLVAGSPGPGFVKKYRKVISKKRGTTSPIKKQLIELFPHYKEDEIDLLSTMVTKKELKQYVKDSGQA